MAITTYEDIMAIKSILDTDSYLNKLGFVPENIYRKNISSEEVTKETMGIYIYASAPDGAVKGLASRQVITINIIAEESKVASVMNASQQCIALLHETDIGNNHRLETRYPPLTLNAPKEVFSQEVAFILETSIYTPIKT